MEHSDIDLRDFPEPIRSMLQGLDIKALENFKNALDRDKVNNMVAGVLEMLKQNMSAHDHQALSRLVDSLMAQKKPE
ncbi:MAG: hypothetical protein ACOYU7_01365 [Bacillota bacterium]